MSAAHPVVGDVPGVRDTVRFVKREALEALDVPWPRGQDLPKRSSSRPEKNDFVIAVSHAWPYQAHPDPLGEKRKPLKVLTEQACAMHKPKGKTLFFFDFVSTSQRPFACGQAQRTAKESEDFAIALKAFPLIYLMADTTIHLDIDLSKVPCDGELFMTDVSELEGVKLAQVGPTVQVVDVVDFEKAGASVAPFDMITSVGKVSVESVADVERGRSATGPRPGSLMGSRLCSNGCSGQAGSTMQMRKAPFGRRNALSANVRGWIFLERFVSMVKVAMVHESQVSGVAFSNSPFIVDEIFRGGAQLRAAASAGKDQLNKVLKDFASMLDTKQFMATSMDKAMDTGGVGGVTAAAAALSNSATGDRDVVWELMVELVEHLEEHWEAEALAQQQRQLVLAVCRGSAAAVTELLQAGVSPNARDAAGCTCLHAAATFRNVDVVRVLLEHRADTAAEDKEGNFPIHVMAYLSEDKTIELFDLLAPSPRELAKANLAGTSPLKKLAAWVDIECRQKPFPPAQLRLEQLRRLHGDILRMKSPGSVERESLSPVPAVRGVEVYAIGGRSVSVHVWEPKDRGSVEVHVLYLSLQWCLPWSLCEPSVTTLAECICSRFKAKLWVLNVDALDQNVVSLGEPWHKLHDMLLATIRALPLNEKFFWVESSLAVVAPVLWQLSDRILGAVLVNGGCYFSDEFEGTPLFDMFSKVIQKQCDTGRARDVDKQLEWLPQWSTASRYEDMVERTARYKAACEAAPVSFWDWWAYVNIDILAIMRVWRTLPCLPSLPVTFAAGALVPPTFILEPITRMRLLLPNSRLAYMPDCRLMWEFEGEGPTLKVASLLVELMDQALAPPVRSVPSGVSV